MFIKRHMLLMLFAGLIFVVGCTEDKQQTKIKNSDLAERYPPNEQYPMGYSDVDLGDNVLRVPHELVGNIRYTSGSVSLFYLWPEFVNSKLMPKDVRGSGVQRWIDTIEIYIYPAGIKEKNPAEKIQHIENKTKILNKHDGQWKQSKKYKDFLVSHTLGDGKADTFTPFDKNIKDPLGQPIIFYCLDFHDDFDKEYSSWDEITESVSLPFCSTKIRWPDGHSITLRYRRKHMPDAIEIYKKVVQLHDDLIIKD